MREATSSSRLYWLWFALAMCGCKAKAESQPIAPVTSEQHLAQLASRARAAAREMLDDTASPDERYNAAKAGRQIAQETLETCWSSHLDATSLADCIGGAEDAFDTTSKWMAEHGDIVDVDFHPFAEHLPSGWRDLRWGMDEKTVSTTIRKYRKDRSNDWVRSEDTELPLFVPAFAPSGIVITFRLATKRFHEWSIANLDAGASEVRAWFDSGKLIALRAFTSEDTLPSAFSLTASHAYGSPPKRSLMAIRTWDSDAHQLSTFEDGLASLSPSAFEAGVDYWRGNRSVALIYRDPHSKKSSVLLHSEEAVRAVLQFVDERRREKLGAEQKTKTEHESATRF
jgi:hypothetical protein